MKLEALRQYATDHAGDSASGKSLREITRWINAALRVCANAREWSFLRDVVSITLTPGVSGSYLGVTQDSDQLTLDPAQTEVFLQTWVDQQRIFIIEGAEPQHYTISTILNPRLARLTAGQTWVAATDAAATYSVVRSLYDLPENTRQVHEVRLASTRQILTPYTVTDFDFLKQAEAGVPVKELCRRHGFSDASFYTWRAKFGGMTVADAKRLKDLELENSRLKKLLAEAHLDIESLKVVARGKG